MFFSIVVTPGGSAEVLSTISVVKPGARVAVMVSVANLPGAYEGASSFAVRVNGGLSVTARPIEVSKFFGGSGRLAKFWLTTVRTLASLVRGLPLIVAWPWI